MAFWYENGMSDVIIEFIICSLHEGMSAIVTDGSGESAGLRHPWLRMVYIRGVLLTFIMLQLCSSCT